MDINEIKELLSQFDASTLTEFDLHEGSFALYMNKNNMIRQISENKSIENVSKATPVSSVLQTSQQSVVTEESIKSVKKAEDFTGATVTSPIVGVVYLQPAPDKPAFKTVGDSVKKGEVICIIEAMKLMNEITSDVDGTIKEILVTNEAVVEYGQPLFHIQPA